MNYRTWLIYRADTVRTPLVEPQVFGYMAWRNHECLQAWYRRAADRSSDRAASDPEHDVLHLKQRWARSRPEAAAGAAAIHRTE